MRDRKIPFHPLLFASFPIFSLFAQNRSILLLSDLVHPVALALGCCFSVWVVLAMLAKSRWTAAMATSWLFLAFYSFPAVRDGWTAVHPVSAATSLAAWLAVTLGVCAAILRSGRDLEPINEILNVTAAVAVGLPFALSLLPLDDAGTDGAAAVPAARAVESSAVSSPARVEWRQAAHGPDATSNLSEPPDVYYVILDGYGRHDVLRRLYDLDNEGFLEALEERGFYVARRSRSNYGQTYLSLASSLNSKYLDDVARRAGRRSTNRAPLREMITGNRAASFLRRRGYTFVAFSSGYTGTEMPDADVYLEPPGAISELGHLLHASTPLPTLDEALGRGDARYRAHRGRIRFTLDQLAHAATEKRPAFVFAHVFAPHPPFVFGPDGEVREPEAEFSIKDGGPFTGDGKAGYVQGYRDQVRFLNRRVLEAIDGILASPRPAIIVLQGDHGPGSCWEHAHPERSDPRERISILNAYYFPDRRYGRLYPEITPVNTFKIIFNQYFAADEPLLEERSYVSTWVHPYGFVDVTDKVIDDVSQAVAEAPPSSAVAADESAAWEFVTLGGS